MKKIVTLAAAGLALVGALALTGCGPRANRANTSNDSTTQQGAQPPTSQSQPGKGGSADIPSVDADVSSVDAVLNDVDSSLASANKAPEDAD
jgi:hypothetical protein